MKQKLITTLLITSMSLGFILSTPPKNTNAETLTNIETEISSKYVADKNIIKTIENKYLKQNSDGTFFISDEAYNEFDKETIESLKSGMEGINDYILSGKLKFKIIEKDNNNEVINTYQSENINNKRQPRAALTLGKIVSNYEYGIEIAKSQGKYKGRLKKYNKNHEDNMTVKQICKITNISKSSLYRRLSEEKIE